MKRTAILLVLLLAAIPITRAQEGHQHRASVDFGGGVVLLRTDYGLSTKLNQGLGITLGVLFKSGFLLRFNLSRVEYKFSSTFDPGGMPQTITEVDDFTRGDATAGYLWNGAGFVRPYLRGGIAIVGVEVEIESSTSGGLTLIADRDSALTLGGGVELGHGPHIFAFDYQVSQGIEVERSFFGVPTGRKEFDFNEMRLDYRYRF